MNIQELTLKIENFMTLKTYLATIGFIGMVLLLWGAFLSGLFMMLMFMLGLMLFEKWKGDLYEDAKKEEK